MKISPTPQGQALSRNQLIRDLTLSSEAPIAFCIRLLLQQLNWSGRQERLFELFGGNPQNMDVVDARNLMLRLGYTSTQEILEDWNHLEHHSLPALYIDPEEYAYVLFNDGGQCPIAANCEGRVELKEIPEGGMLVEFQETSGNDRSAFLQKLIYRFRNRLALLYCISFGMALLALVVPFYIRATYNLVIPSESGFTGTGLYIGVLLLFLLDWTLRQWRSNQLSNLTARIDALAGLRLIEKTLELDSNQASVFSTRNFQNQQRSLDALLVYLQGPLAMALLDFPFVVVYLGAIYVIAGPLVLIPLVLMAITAVLVLVLGRYYTIATEMNLSSEIGVAQSQQELVNRFLEVKQSNLEWVWLQRLRGLSAQSTTSSLLVNRQLGRLQVIVSTAAQLAGTLTLAAGVWIAHSNPSNYSALGTLIAAMFFVWRVFTPFQQLMNAMVRFSTMRRQFTRLDQFLKLRQTSRLGSAEGSARLYGSILLDSAASRLGRDNSLVLTRTSLSVDPGQILAITGKAGCGKSASLRVINQIYPLSSGTLLFDGRDHRQFSTDVIQNNIAFVMEKTELLPGTILSNLQVMNHDVTVDRINKILDKLKIRNYLETLPEGLHTSIDEALVYQLPHGVLRLLSLAQALIKDTPIMLIDDLSQGLTPEQFQTFLEALPTFRRSEISGKSRSVLIATDNRLILEKVDQICILDRGVTSFQGTADDLRQRLQQMS